MFGADDLATLFGDAGVMATCGADSATVLIDMPDQIILGEMQVSADYMMTVRSGDLPALARGVTVTVDGVDYLVREIRRIDDGALSHVALKRP
jgi:hypothetical protein